jgi:O-antigen ligase
LRLLIVAGALATVCVAIATAAPPRPPSVHGGVSGDRAHVAQSSFLHGREQEWVTALQTWLDRPLLGAGAAAYYIASAAHQKVARSLYAHNLPLELAAELGIPGLMLTIALYWQTARAIVQRWRSPVLWMLAPTAAFFLLSNLLDWTWHLAALGAIWAAATGAMLGSPTLPPP